MADETKPAEDDSTPDPEDPKAKFLAMMDEWADAREANRPKNKTNAPQPRSILDELFGR